MVMTEKETKQETATEEVVLERPVSKSYFGSITAETEAPLFEIEKEYNNFDNPEKAKRSQMLPEFDILPDAKSKTEPKACGAPLKDIKLSLRGKILTTVACMVTMLLLTLVIYNAVVLGAKRAEINSLQAQLSSSITELSELQNELVSAQSEEEVAKLLQQSGSTLRKATSADKVKVAIEAYELEKYSTPTNWFDKICEFLSNLFR